MSGGWDRVRTVADAVLYEGYLLYPYRANSRKNQSRWQFGVLGPAGGRGARHRRGRHAVRCRCFVRPGTPRRCRSWCRFLQLQRRTAERDTGDGCFEPVDELTAGDQTWLTWDEAVERELSFGPFAVADLEAGQTIPLGSPAARTSKPSTAAGWSAAAESSTAQLSLAARTRRRPRRASAWQVRNTGAPPGDKDDAIADVVHRHAPDRRGRRRRVRLAARPAAAWPTTRSRAADSTAASRCWPAARRARPDARVADHPLRPSGDRRTERRRAVRLHRDRRDPHAARDDDDRRGEGAGPGHRPAGRPDHRPLRLDVARGDAQSAWRAAESARTARRAGR